MVRYNVRKFNHLPEVLGLLKRVVLQPRLTFSGLQPDRPPLEDELRDMLLAFNRNIMTSTIESLENYITFRAAYWKNFMAENGIVEAEKRKTHDRSKYSVKIQVHV